MIKFFSKKDVVLGAKYEQSDGAVTCSLVTATDGYIAPDKISYNFVDEQGEIVENLEDALIIAHMKVTTAPGESPNYMVVFAGNFPMFRNEFEQIIQIIQTDALIEGVVMLNKQKELVV